MKTKNKRKDIFDRIGVLGQFWAMLSTMGFIFLPIFVFTASIEYLGLEFNLLQQIVFAIILFSSSLWFARAMIIIVLREWEKHLK